jgi:hypothetical protein
MYREIKSGVEGKQKTEKKDKNKDKERELLESRSQPMRKYLMDKVIPYLAEGVLKICGEQPEDPIRYLIGFLEMKSKERLEEEKLKAEQKANMGKNGTQSRIDNSSDQK